MGTHEVGGGRPIENGLDPLPIAVIHEGGTRETGGHCRCGGRSASGREGDGRNEGLGRGRGICRGIGWSGSHRGQGVLNMQVGGAVHIPVKCRGDAFARTGDDGDTFPRW